MHTSHNCFFLFTLFSITLTGCGSEVQTGRGETLTSERAFDAAFNNDLDTVMIALENEVVTVNEQDDSGRTLLHYSAGGPLVEGTLQTSVAYWLLENYSADPDVRDKDGHGALYYARQIGNVEVANLIEGSGGTE